MVGVGGGLRASGWLERERIVGPLRVVVRDEGAQDALEVAAVRISSQSRHSASTVLTSRSAVVFAFGARTGVWTIRMPPARNT
jgi:hypothetical protein